MTRSALRSFCIGAVTILLVACKPQPKPPALVTAPSTATAPAGGVTYSGGDSSSIEKAVVVNAANEDQGVKAEYVWLQDHYPGYHRGNQYLRKENGHPYDQLDIVTKEGLNRSVYFDITPFFGK